MNELMMRLKTPCLRPLVLENESPASPDSMTSPGQSNAERLVELEQSLIVSSNPDVIKETVTQLHAATSGRKFRYLCCHWEASELHNSMINSVASDPVKADIVAIMLAKSELCCRDGDYGAAKQLVSYLHVSANIYSVVGR